MARLTRYQHILLRLGELIAYAECAGSLARRAALLADGKLNEKANRRFDATALAAVSRIFAREAALKVARRRFALGHRSGRRQRRRPGRFCNNVGMPAIHRAQAGLISDMDYVADVLYSRAAKPRTWLRSVGRRMDRIRTECSQCTVLSLLRERQSWKTLHIEP